MFCLGACCYPSKTIIPTSSVEKDMKLVSDTIRETSNAVDILTDDSLSVEERMRLYGKRMEEINNKLKERR